MQFTVMSFNLRYDKPDPGVRQWQNRVKAIASLIKHYQPDLLGTQEGKAHQINDLKALLPEYHTIGGDRTGTGTGEYCTIFYHPHRLQCHHTQDFFLSETPEVPGSITPHWNNRLPRMATWGKFKIDGIPYFINIVNTHLDHESVKARELGAALIYQRLGELSPDDYLLVSGDFNATPQTKERQIFQTPLSNGKKLIDTVATLPYNQQKTFHDFTGQPSLAIDTIYSDRRLQVEQIIIDRKQWENVWPSDHFPVIIKLNLNPNTNH